MQRNLIERTGTNGKTSMNGGASQMQTYSHGKRKVRVGKVRRGRKRHDFVEYEVAVQLEGATEKAFTEGDNSLVISTDTVKNNCYVVAKANEMLSPESYSIALASHMLKEYEFVSGVRVRTVEKPWTRVHVNGQPHAHGYVRGSFGDQIAEVQLRRDGNLSVRGLMENLDILKTTQSGWEGFYKDRYTTLPETSERMLATTVSAAWDYSSIRDVDFVAVHERILDVIKQEFYGDPETGKYSPGVQNTQYLIATKVLQICPEVDKIELTLPNIHFLPCKIPAFEKNNIPFEDDVFIPTSEPQGEIQCTLVRPRARM
eukprot:Plantae.Rhodophyta-Purpureofilum_apyrenoidigerum.ctg6531.p1 GENE.Plantae.Rhodophyta-Purpureofilum_apyrenoidigerum.ctg6531~~Plantae.Rhodophyta-Purpureofilum_apyrenoidigerum.ctg6531.p1  ORF type:complete len:315 (+),score=53.43 Plantae.Rhodophyta-Purpureofilum_apyrenoidigerum.ctg6531:86-1030(+)